MWLSKGLLFIEFFTHEVCNIMSVSTKSMHNLEFFSGISFLIIVGNIFIIRELSTNQLYIITYYLSYSVHIPIAINTDFVWWTSELYIVEMRKVFSTELFYLLSTMRFEIDICVKLIFSFQYFSLAKCFFASSILMMQQ